MPLLRRKPVLLHPLPSLASIIQSPHAPSASASADVEPSTSNAGASSSKPSAASGSGKGKKPRASSPGPGAATGAGPAAPPLAAELDWTPLDGRTDAEQLELLSALFDPTLAASSGGTQSVMTKARKREDVRLVPVSRLGAFVKMHDRPSASKSEGAMAGANGTARGNGHGPGTSGAADKDEAAAAVGTGTEKAGKEPARGKRPPGKMAMWSGEIINLDPNAPFTAGSSSGSGQVGHGSVGADPNGNGNGHVGALGMGMGMGMGMGPNGSLPLPADANALGASGFTSVPIPRGKASAAPAAPAASAVPPPPPKEEEWRVWDREVYYLPETGEIFLDYESYCSRRLFLEQPQFQCEISSKSTLSYAEAVRSEQREVRQLHSRFPKQLKRAVLAAVQFQVEGKLDHLADKVFERFENRFFDNEKIFVDVEGDKYLARIIRSFPPKKLASQISSGRYPLKPGIEPSAMHPLAVDLNLDNETVEEVDDPMAYFYNVRLITETDPEAEGDEDPAVGRVEYASSTSKGNDKENGNGDATATAKLEEEAEAKWGGSVMEVKADQLSRDRMNFSRAMLRRFLRDCVTREATVYAPWLLKTNVAVRYSLPLEMPDEVRARIAEHKREQMDKRKRDRDERLGIVHVHGADGVEVKEEEDDKPDAKKRKRAPAGDSAARAKGGKMTEEEKQREREEQEEKRKFEEDRRRKRFHKYCLDDLTVEYKADKDAAAGRIGLRPAPKTDLPFEDKFEQLLMTWSFLNVMGEPLHLSPFSLDEFETALYHQDASAPSLLLTEIHAVMLNCLAEDLAAGHPAVRPLAHVEKADGGDGSSDEDAISDSDYWEGDKGATTETLRPLAQPLGETWSTFTIPPAPPGPMSAANLSANRKGWQDSLIGCLWERASLETLPGYLDDILHMLFEPKPPPTRPTWSTAPPSTGPLADLLHARPEKRYWSLHHRSKLAIVAWLCELVGQTEAVKQYMEESTDKTTEARKERIEVQRELRRVQAALNDLEPKPKTEEGDENASAVPSGRDASRSPSAAPRPNVNGNGHGADTSELDIDSAVGDDIESASRASSPISDIDAPSHAHAAAARRKALATAAAERSALEAERKANLAKSAAAAKEKRAETKQHAADKKKLQDEAESYEQRLAELNYAFRSALFTLRTQPLGVDRFGNKVWWFDGIGSAPVRSSDGKIILGTGRIYVQGPDELELDLLRQQGAIAAAAHWSAFITEERYPLARERAEMMKKDVLDAEEMLTPANLKARRLREEGEHGVLAPGQWGIYDSPEDLEGLMAYLNPRGNREAALLKVMTNWKADILAGMQKRRVSAGVLEPGKEERGIRTRKGAEGEGIGHWKNKRAQ